MEELDEDADIRFQSVSARNLSDLKRAWLQISAGAFIKRRQTQLLVALVRDLARVNSISYENLAEQNRDEPS